MTLLFGIKNCDTVRKARSWLEQNQQEYQFHDFRTDGLDEKTLKKWVDHLGWESLLNKRSTSFRQLTDQQKLVDNAEDAIALMLATPTLIKRPVLSFNDHIQIGFKPEAYQQLFQQVD
ncbi:ArsC family reductase [Corallincola spongiicola]|uniref:ArsC family reductase n=1 Tax=Corallincola spongiicola TaxID=2520508 RepID=A0ABY1WV91_9GAMM|nr:ArsC family reductase [Corallincola spongiicola]TAA48645.1 ArsC family reductase [Corallincola spongiicola]